MVKTKKLLVTMICAFALVSAFALVGCGSEEPAEAPAPEQDAVQLQIFAANSLEKALPEVQALYTEETGVTFADTQFKGSGTLVTELQGGATADVLMTASKGKMDKAVEDGSVDKATRVDLFVNDLVVCAAQDSDYEVADLSDLASSSAISSIAIGEPNAVPAGKYAAQSLESAGLCTIETNEDGNLVIVWDPSVADKMNAGADKVGTVASYVKEGQCNVGIVYSSDIYRYDGIKAIYTIPDDFHKAIMYPGAVCSSSEHAQEANDFIQFCLTNPDAQKIFSEYGFELAG